MQAVGQLDDQYADVLGHGDDHLADRLGLRTVAVLELVELGDAVHEHRDLVTEIGAQHVKGVCRVLHGVVEESGSERLRSDPEVGEDLRDGDRMRDVWLAALA